LKNNLLIGGLIVATLVAAVFLVKSTREQARSADFPEGMHWLCSSCQHGFSTSREAFAEWVDEHPDELLECPQCHKHTSKVARHCPLPDCGKYYTQANMVVDGTVCCPICKNPLP
jgi:hypothetical protein